MAIRDMQEGGTKAHGKTVLTETLLLEYTVNRGFGSCTLPLDDNSCHREDFTREVVADR